MRQFVLGCSVFALLMYAGLVVEANGTTANANGVATAQLAPLESALIATGATLDKATLTAWAPAGNAKAVDQIKALLGWGAVAPKGEERSIKAYTQQGAPYVMARVVLTGARATGWQATQTVLRQGFVPVGATPSLSVQLEGVTPTIDIVAAREKSLDAVGAKDRQPWVGPLAASSAATSRQLPPSSYGANLQVALRIDPSGKQARVWVAWPTLQQEY